MSNGWSEYVVMVPFHAGVVERERVPLDETRIGASGGRPLHRVPCDWPAKSIGEPRRGKGAVDLRTGFREATLAAGGIEGWVGQQSQPAELEQGRGATGGVTWRRERLILTRRISDAAATPPEIPR
jgi:hypothetical protein